MQHDDRTLVRAWCAGDPGAYSELLLRHIKLLRRVAIVTAGALVSRDELVIDDILQDACMRLLDAFKRYKGDCEPHTFMAGVVRHCALDAVRNYMKYQRKRVFAQTVHDTQEHYHADTADILIESMENEKIIALLSRIGEPDRSLLYLREAEGVELKELCAMFKMPLGTVKSKISRAREKLRKLALEEEEI